MRIDAVAIEAAAAAIHRVVANRSGRGRDWSAIAESLKAEFREEARAALEATSGRLNQ